MFHDDREKDMIMITLSAQTIIINTMAKVSAHPSEKQMEKLRLGEGGGDVVEGGEVGD